MKKTYTYQVEVIWFDKPMYTFRVYIKNLSEGTMITLGLKDSNLYLAYLNGENKRVNAIPPENFKKEGGEIVWAGFYPPTIDEIDAILCSIAYAESALKQSMIKRINI